MTKDVLLSTEFDSAYDAMIALNVFLENIDALPTDSRCKLSKSKSNWQSDLWIIPLTGTIYSA